MRRQVAAVMLVVAMVPSAAWAQEQGWVSTPPAPIGTTVVPPEKKMRSPKLVLAGIGTMIAGALIALPIPYGGENQKYFGTEYCIVNTQYEFDAIPGRCPTTTPHVTVGLYTLLAGGALVAIGASRVTVSPLVGHARGARVTVRWGGR